MKNPKKTLTNSIFIVNEILEYYEEKSINPELNDMDVFFAISVFVKTMAHKICDLQLEEEGDIDISIAMKMAEEFAYKTKEIIRVYTGITFEELGEKIVKEYEEINKGGTK